jgi:membrane dipeptidase
MAIIPPERLPEITESLLRHGFADDDVAGIMGRNFLRVADETWPVKPVEVSS